ncbi:MAG: T9SS type A sorting domain-containing protein, partial [Saprospiraceae bacterium]
TITRRISTEGIEIEDIDGEKFKVPDAFIDIDINLDKKVPVPTEDKLIIYPNPAKEAVQLHFNGKNIIKGYKMYDAMGSIVGAVSELNQQKVSVNTSELPSGIYVVQVVTTQGTISKKIKILNK